jgi:hypothetical protein
MLRLWDVTAGKEVRRCQGNGYTLSAITFSADGKYLAAAFNSGPPVVMVWETATGVRVGEFGAGRDCSFCGLAFAPDGKILASACWDGTVRLWEVATSKECRCFRGRVGPVRAVAYSPDGRRLVSGGDDTLGLVWDVLGRGGACSDAELQLLWVDLASTDSGRSYRAIGRLVGAGDQAVTFLAEHLHPAPRATPQRLMHLIADLDSEAFTARQEASRELEILGEVAEQPSRACAERSPPALRLKSGADWNISWRGCR